MKIAVYGTLRVGDYNHSYFSSGLKSISERVKISGFKLYSLGPYPCAVKTDDDNDTIIVDVLDPTDKRTERMIDGMERGAGYHFETTNVNGEDCKIYLFKKPSGDHIENGDWMDYKYGLKQRSEEEIEEPEF
jgi:gamma-glutamylcyclotransferase (GGCT)/AIG2-like uncharacterized protein YtfP